MKQKLSDRQIQAYRLVSGEFDGLPVKVAAELMDITPQAVNRLLSRARTACPQLFPFPTKQEVNVKALLVAGLSDADIAEQLQVCLSRVRQIRAAIREKKRGVFHANPVNIIRYETWMDSKIRRKF